MGRVTTPRGCTIAGLNQMEHEGFSSAISKVLRHQQRSRLNYSSTVNFMYTHCHCGLQVILVN
ncbi:MAG: pyrroline-5-carboxylate reductase dimerization domain-containing protein [bacterium]